MSLLSESDEKNTPDPISGPSIDTTFLNAVKKEELYDEFEEQWQNGIRPNIQTFLERYRATNPAESQSVLREQLCIELDQLLHRGEIPQLTEYKTVFPDDVDCILSSFREISAKVELTPTLDAARFRMIDLLEKGGQGEIWLRYDTLVERLVALKCVASSEWNSPEIQAEFRREAVIGGTLEHPNIAPVYELTEQRHPWGITEPAPPYSSCGHSEIRACMPPSPRFTLGHVRLPNCRCWALYVPFRKTGLPNFDFQLR